MRNRILWLLNHTTLCDFEVPLLIELGFEVFVPKFFPDDEANGSASVTYEYDNTLTIDKNDLQLLNETDFYNGNYDSKISSIINKNFTVAISGFFLHCLERLLDDFDGKIFLRVFGMGGGLSYFDYIKEYVGEYYLSKINRVSHRFWFAAAYTEIIDNESDLFKKRAVFLPLGIKEAFYKNENTWTGEDKKLFFVCPRIKSSPYYENIYRKFKANFSEFPHIIAGKQFLPIDDPSVTGYQTSEQYQKCFIRNGAMFYHSQEARHLHYHPIEAIIVGMPVIFMSGGILETLGGKEQPGLCATVEQAKEKIARILNKDKKFISEITEKQKSISEKFTMKYCKKVWTENFIPLVYEIDSLPAQTKLKRIAVILPVSYKGGTLGGLRNIVRMLDHASSAMNEPLEIIIYCVANFYDIEKDFSEIAKKNIKIREFTFQECNAYDAERMLRFARSPVKPCSSKTFYVINDHYKSATDCDFWILISDRFTRPLLPLRPYAMVIYDYIQRYIPEMMDSAFESIFSTGFVETTRMAKLILTTTPQTAADVKNYLGIEQRKIACTGLHFDPLIENQMPSPDIVDFINSKRNYFIWTTNVARHKNTNAALDAIKMYIESGGNCSVIITGVDTDKLDPKRRFDSLPSIIHEIRKKIDSEPVFSNKLFFMGNLDTPDYLHVLKSAKFLFHPALIDNGTFSVLEAAVHNVPSACSNYPQMLYISEQFNLEMCFFDPYDTNSIAETLSRMERCHPEYQKKLPTQEIMLSKSYLSYSEGLWNIIRRAIR